MRILSFAHILLLLFLSCFVVVSPTVILTQNVTNTVEDSITVFPGITIQITCMVINSSSLLWEPGDSSGNALISGFNYMTFVSDEVGGFTILLSSFNSSLISSTATAVSSSNTSLTCSDNDGNIETIEIYIKPVDPQIYMIQNVTIAAPLLVYWSGNWTMDKAFL
uniref:Ig-like domain-containing protein n=1 Tax=Amphimedon queenslandica TaxID=400682 RepID=A0A1X7SH09_AMPQE